MPAELPPVRVKDPPLRHRTGLLAYWKKLVTIALALGAMWFVCRKLKGQSFEERDLESARKTNTAAGYVRYASFNKDPHGAYVDLWRLHETARDRIRAAGGEPDGLDPIFARLLDRMDHKVSFVLVEHGVDRASFDRVAPLLVAPGAEVAPLADHLDVKSGCDRGFSEAFAELTGSDVIVFDTSNTPPIPQLRVRWKARASGTGYAQASTRRIYPGILLAAELELTDAATALANMKVEVSPGPDINWTTYGLRNPFSKSGDDAGVASALVAGACKQAGFALIERLTRWKPAAKQAPALDELEKKCRSGNGSACLEVATKHRDGAGVPADRERAAKLFADGCRTGSVDAGRCCVEGAALIVDEPADRNSAGGRYKAELMLETGCRANYPEACAKAGTLAFGRTLIRFELENAAAMLARGCDLGSAAACSRLAAAIVEPGIDAPLYGGAAALARRACAGAPCPDAERWAKQAGRDTVVFGVPLGKDRVFDLRWGSWEPLDSGQVVAWVASGDTYAAVQERVRRISTRVYAAGDLPYGVTPPAGTQTVWAVIAKEPRTHYEGRCGECKTGEGSPPVNVGCTCLPLRGR